MPTSSSRPTCSFTVTAGACTTEPSGCKLQRSGPLTGRAWIQACMPAWLLARPAGWRSVSFAAAPLINPQHALGEWMSRLSRNHCPPPLPTGHRPQLLGPRSPYACHGIRGLTSSQGHARTATSVSMPLLNYLCKHSKGLVSVAVQLTKPRLHD